MRVYAYVQQTYNTRKNHYEFVVYDEDDNIVLRTIDGKKAAKCEQEIEERRARDEEEKEAKLGPYTRILGVHLSRWLGEIPQMPNALSVTATINLYDTDVRIGQDGQPETTSSFNIAAFYSEYVGPVDNDTFQTPHIWAGPHGDLFGAWPWSEAVYQQLHALITRWKDNYDAVRAEIAATASPADTATPPKAPNSNRRSHSDSPPADRP